MANLVLRGTYKNGRVELSEVPADIAGEVEVLVAFPTSSETAVVASESEQSRLRREAFEQMSRGISLGGGPYYKNREDLHDRPNRFGGTGAG